MIEVEPSRYRRVTGGIAIVDNLLDFTVADDTKQSDDPESISARKRELNPAATAGTNSGGMVRHSPERTTELLGRTEEIWT